MADDVFVEKNVAERGKIRYTGACVPEGRGEFETILT